MNARPMLSDRALEAMLERRAGRARVDDLPEVIVMAVSTEPVPRRPLLGRPGWLPRPALTGRPALVVAVLVLAATAVAASVGAWLLLREPPPAFPLQPTGFELMRSSWLPRAIAPDAGGGLWVQRVGGLSRFDAEGRLVGEWSVADDQAMLLGYSTPSGIAAAPDGGVWVWQEDAVRHFDGRAFTDVLDLDARVVAVAAGAGRTVWVGTEDGRVVTWDGSTLATPWSRARDGAAMAFTYTTARALELAVSPTGEVWGVFGSQDAAAVIGRYDGATWRYWGRDDGILLRNGILELAVAPDGTAWLLDSGSNDSALLRFDGVRWEEQPRPPVFSSGLAIGPGGIPWVLAPVSEAVMAWHLEGGQWLAVDVGDNVAYTLVLAASEAAVVVATEDGLGRLQDGRLELLWSRPADAFEPTQIVGGGEDPVWVLQGAAVTPYRDGAWGPSVALPADSHGVALDPDGRLWAWGAGGVAIREGNAWRVIDGGQADRVVPGPAGDAWAVTYGSSDEWGYTISPPTLRHLVQDAGTWRVVDQVSLAQAPGALAADSSAGLLVAGEGANPSDMRVRSGGTWTDIPLPSAGASPLLPGRIVDVAYAPSGDLWALAAQWNWSPLTSLTLGVSRGGQWTAFGCIGETAATPTPPPCAIASVLDRWRSFDSRFAFGPDGTVWFAGDGLARFDGETWSLAVEGIPLGNPVVAADGSIWAMGEGTILRYVPED